MAGRPRLRFVHAALAGSLLLGACIINLDNLSSGSAGGTGGTGGASASSGSGTSTGTSTGSTAGSTGPGSGSSSSTAPSSGSSSSGSGDGGCPLLDCSCVTGPTVVAANTPLADTPYGIAVTNDGVYWTDQNGGAVAFAPASGGAPQKLAAANIPYALDVSGSTVVWSAQEGLFSCTATSCATSKHQVLNSAMQNSIHEVAYDGLVALWADVGSGTNSGKVIACTLATCAPVDMQDNLIAAGGVRLYGGAAFWTEMGNGNQNGSVSTSPETTVSVSQIASALDVPRGIVADDTYVFWTSWKMGGHVYRCPRTGGTCNTPTDIAPMAAGGFGHPFDIRLAGGRVYWSTTDDGTIQSCPEPDCGSAMPTVHVSGRQGLQRFTIGSSCLFWTELGMNGAVMKMAR